MVNAIEVLDASLKVFDALVGLVFFYGFVKRTPLNFLCFCTDRFYGDIGKWIMLISEISYQLYLKQNK